MKYVSITRKDSGLEISGQYKLRGINCQEVHDQIMRLEDYFDRDLIDHNKIKTENSDNKRSFFYRSFFADVNINMLSLDIDEGKRIITKTGLSIMMMGDSQTNLSWDIQRVSDNETVLTCKGRVNISGIMASKMEDELFNFYTKLVFNLLKRFKENSVRIFHDRKWVDFA